MPNPPSIGYKFYVDVEYVHVPNSLNGEEVRKLGSVLVVSASTVWRVLCDLISKLFLCTLQTSCPLSRILQSHVHTLVIMCVRIVCRFLSVCVDVSKRSPELIQLLDMHTHFSASTPGQKVRTIHVHTSIHVHKMYSCV